MPFRIALCNEVVRDLAFERQCEFAAALGYDGLEVAPFTLSDAPQTLAPARIAALRQAAAGAGIAIAGLHWLLIKPDALSLTDADPAVRRRTTDVINRLVGLCAELGGGYLVHGSPAQRLLPAPPGDAAARGWASEALAMAAEAAAAHGVIYCLEPLSRRETNFVNTIEEAAALLDAIGRPALRTMLDVSAASLTELDSPAALLARWLPRGVIGHVQVNDASRRGPGQGATPIAPVLHALREHGYDGWIGVEPFDYVPDGPASAARAAGYLRGLEAAL